MFGFRWLKKESAPELEDAGLIEFEKKAVAFIKDNSPGLLEAIGNDESARAAIKQFIIHCWLEGSFYPETAGAKICARLKVKTNTN